MPSPSLIHKHAFGSTNVDITNNDFFNCYYPSLHCILLSIKFRTLLLPSFSKVLYCKCRLFPVVTKCLNVCKLVVINMSDILETWH